MLVRGACGASAFGWKQQIWIVKSLHFGFGLCLALALLCSGCSAWIQEGAISRAQSGIAKGKYNFALRRLNEAGHSGKPAIESEIIYLKGVCYEGLAAPEEANALFQFVADRFPDTQYGYMAREKLTNDTVMSIEGPAAFSLYADNF